MRSDLINLRYDSTSGLASHLLGRMRWRCHAALHAHLPISSSLDRAKYYILATLSVVLIFHFTFAFVLFSYNKEAGDVC